jgi:hypothetical protein
MTRAGSSCHFYLRHPEAHVNFAYLREMTGLTSIAARRARH